MFKKLIIPLLLVFAMSCENNSNPKEQISNNDWEVVSISNSNELSTTPWIRFDLTENKVNGNAGCNDFFGTVDLTDSSITFGTLGATKKMCPDMTAEDALFDALNNVASYKLEDNKLFFVNNDNQTVVTLQIKSE